MDIRLVHEKALPGFERPWRLITRRHRITWNPPRRDDGWHVLTRVHRYSLPRIQVEGLTLGPLGGIIWVRR